jgi:hypothetical protein
MGRAKNSRRTPEPGDRGEWLPLPSHYDVRYRPTHRARMVERLFLSSGKKEFGSC